MMLGPALFSLLLAARAAASPSPYDFKDNYHDPAPSPEDGPPASFHATRDRGRLPYEICGLVGGYVFTVLIWGILLLTVGRKMRRKALKPPALEIEQELKPIRPAMETPISPGSMRSATSWVRKFKRGESLSGSTPVSPAVQSPMSFDQKVIDADKMRAQDDMERLYAAVMDHDAKKHSRQNSRATVDEPLPPVRTERRRPSAVSTHRAPADSTHRAPADSTHRAPTDSTHRAPTDSTHRAPTDSTPTSPVKAIYPPDFSNMAAPLPHSRNSSLRAEHPPPSPRSILTKPSRVSSTSRQDKSARFNLKNLRISGPIHSYGGAAPDDEARTPLSPRFYPDPGAPPSPPTQPTSPSTPYSPTEPAEIQRAHSLRIPLPNPAPQRGPGLTISPPAAPKPASRSPLMTPTTQLPFRSYQSESPLKSPGIQTTVLDRRPDKLSLQTPRTGVPFTPYSPYMPFTPITPVTPHLVTKKERRGRRKEGSERLGTLDELVQSPKEIFGDAY